jgi:sucrose-6F-phosphate phosphohydrolase
LGDDLALTDFAEWYASARKFFRLAYASGRFVKSICESIHDTQLPDPDAIIGGVGTEIYDVLAGRRMPMWPPSIFEWNPYQIREICDSHAKLVPQPEHLLSFYKVSYYGCELDQVFLADLEQQLIAAGQRVTIVYSSNRDLDILPAEANKGSAVAHVSRCWKIETRRVIVAGDSGNDLAMFEAGFCGIVVRNARQELLSVKAPHVYHASAPYAYGVLEGLGYWLETANFAITGDLSSVVQGADRDMRE